MLSRLQVVHVLRPGPGGKAPTVTDTDHSGMVGATCAFTLGEVFRDWHAYGPH